jgi:hypothetical protein
MKLPVYTAFAKVVILAENKKPARKLVLRNPSLKITF